MPRYFRVIYRGLGFPSNLRDKQFIFEGGSAERISSFTDRMRQQHPSAQIVPAGDIDSMEGQYLQIFPVSPHRDLEHHLYQQSRVPHSIKEFVLSSQPSRFAVTSRRHSPASGVKDQWIEKTIYTTSEPFPTISKRSEIIAINVARLSPLQTAVERTSRKTAEIAGLEKRVMDEDESAVFSLMETIKSSVDPASVASVAQYRQILPEPPTADTSSEETPEDFPLPPLQNALRLALLDHALTIKHALTVLSRRNLSDLSTLNENFQISFAPELCYLTPQPEYDPSPPPTVSTPLSPPLSPSAHQHTDSFATVTNSAPQLSLSLPNGAPTSPTTDDNAAQRPQLGDTSKRSSRLSLNFLKGSSNTSAASKGERSSSAKDSDSVSASTVSQRADPAMVSYPRPSASTGSMGQGKGLSLGLGGGSGRSIPTINGGDERSGSNSKSKNREEDPEGERPVTAQSSRSGRVKKRLSLLGIGNGGGSKLGGSLRRRAGAGDLSGMVEE